VKGAANPMDMLDRRILVTGAASGIGRATAVLLSLTGSILVVDGGYTAQ